eukprot:CAMPEP_0204374034 /NCGR_PEP_ID=MMETSP0469-20131031/48419_1 /ASSEMBLY_ACC=CAM_ASM_000384 /TAXON_ID=2969 /ORGANISM="Oxyrrhis marina" /LENGTH=255 /DNA_ID=CAMNT_0051364579 /DNA_START=8 /DNA_END=775 /DNA_ORIENTATION=+
MAAVGRSVYNFSGLRAIVTGAGKGIGRDICKALVNSGAIVHGISRTQADLDSLAQELGENMQGVAADLEAPEAIKEAMDKCGDVDMLINNAGIASLAPFLDQDADSFTRMFNVNCRTAMLCGQHAARSMIARGVKGSIVNVSSQASLVALPDHTAYCASKAAMDMLSKSMAMELGPHGIRCNAVNPTVVLTDMGQRAWGEETKARPMLNRIPLGKFAVVDDVVRPILFLLSEDAAMVNGSVVPIEGGLMASCTLK